MWLLGLSIVGVVFCFLLGIVFATWIIDDRIRQGRLPMGLYRQKDAIKNLINEKEGGDICTGAGSEPALEVKPDIKI